MDVSAPIELLTSWPELKLRNLNDADAGELFRAIDGSREFLRRWLPWIDTTRSPNDSLSFIHFVRRQSKEQQALHCAIALHGKIIGIVGFNRIEKTDRRATLGYWLAAGAVGHGYATEAARTLIAFGFESLHLEQIEIRVDPENYASRAVCDRLGCRNGGLMRASEWMKDRFVDYYLYLLDRPGMDAGKRAPIVSRRA